MTPESPSRTFIGSVVCVDLVGYSKRPVDRQIAIKAAFNKLLGQCLDGVPAEDRIILDTGDGAAVSFLGDPEEGLLVGQLLRKSMNAAAARLGAEPGTSPVRIGIHLGPVRVAVDMNGHPKIIGDGITVAERIMAFAEPGQIAVSRPYHDMVSRLSDQHAGLFRHEGTRVDRNGREHDLYFIDAAEVKPRPSRAKAVAPGTPGGEGALAAFLRDRAKVGFAAALLLAVIAAEVAYLATKRPAPPPEIASAPAPVSAEAPPAAATAPTAVPAAPPEAKPATPPAKSEPAPPARSATKPAPAAPAPAATPPPEPKPVAPAKAEPPQKAMPKSEPKPDPKPAPAKADTKPAPAKPEAKPTPRRDDPKAPVKADPKPEARPEPRVETAPEAPPPKAEEPKPAPAPPPPATTIVARVPPEFPRAAVIEGIAAGTVKARLRINAQGGVTDVAILAADPPRVFDRAAVRALENWKFNPGAANRTYDVEIAFKR